MPITAPAITAKDAVKDNKKDAQPRSHVREGIETVVFVVTLVLLLKLFVVEAFVIPTGSMAETLYGYQKIVTCSQCKFEFPVNSHDEVEGNPATKQKSPLLGYCCPNCRYKGGFNNTDNPTNRSGDRVLVLKPIYHITHPQRGDVVVFKYPEKPEDDRLSAQNYIKRGMGFGGETVAIFRGELFTTRDLTYPEDLKNEDGEPQYPRPENPLDAWQKRYMYSNAHHNRNPLALDRFAETRTAGFPQGEKYFQIVRKTDAQVLARKRIVWDNEHQPESLKGQAKPRWAIDGAGWNVDDPDAPKVFTHAGGDQQWMRYHNLVAGIWPPATDPKNAAPIVIKNFLGYNAGFTSGFEQPRASQADEAWVGDLIIECEVEFAADTEVALELSRSIHRYRATFSGGNVTLSQVGGEEKTFSTRSSGISGGKHSLRFANVDSRLRVWVDGSAIDFGDEANYAPVMVTPPNGGTEGWTKENDEMQPASIGVKGAATVRKVTLWRDIYYTHKDGALDPESAEVYYIQPGHYMCLGDNSAQSSDSRMSGAVPERLLLGKAVFVFWPLTFDKDTNRVGFIR